MKFRVGLVVDEDHLGKVLAALQTFRVEMVGIDACPAAPAIPTKKMKDVTPNKVSRPVHTGPTVTSLLLEALAKHPLTTKEALTVAKKAGRTEQSAYGALNVLRARNKVTRLSDMRWALAETHMEVASHG